MDVIRTQDLQYTYDGAESPALDGLDFDVDRGEIFGFLGPSGAGKTTTQKVLIGLLDDYEGEATILGRSVRDWDSNLYRHIGVAPETPSLYHRLTGRENLGLFASLYGSASRDPLKLLDQVGIGDVVDQHVGTYSKGMKIRLNFVRALIHEPELVFLDEPTAGIDPTNARAVMDVIEDLRGAGTTVFLTTHDMAVADHLCDHVAFIVDGQLPVIDTPRKLKIAHGRPTVRIEFSEDESEHEDRTLREQEFPLENLDVNDEFHELLRENRIETIHTEEATLADVFIAVTGKELR